MSTLLLVVGSGLLLYELSSWWLPHDFTLTGLLVGGAAILVGALTRGAEK